MTGATAASTTAPKRHDRALVLSALLLVQVLCTAFFLVDVIADLLGWDGLLGETWHHLFELAVVVALMLSTAFTVVQFRKVQRRNERMAAQLRLASGAFIDLLEEHFDSWSLTPSERDVALLTIKGLSNAEIAALRTTKEGTVKAQCNAIYSKAGVSGRPQLLSLFIEEMVGGRLGEGGSGADGTAQAAQPRRQPEHDPA